MKEGASLSSAAKTAGEVIKFNKESDLALVRVGSIPVHVFPVSLGDTEQIEVGSDVHAIGHPTGEMWTYTRGIISQIRKDYTWHADGKSFKADVIQTQTPISC